MTIVSASVQSRQDDPSPLEPRITVETGVLVTTCILIAGLSLFASLVGQASPGLEISHIVGQWLTMAALVGLGWRDGRCWQSGWLAACLYMLTCYGFGHDVTAGRDAWALLPILMMAHLVEWGISGRRSHPTFPGASAAAGTLGAIVFMLNPWLGCCFGILWLDALARGWRQRQKGFSAYANAIALAVGFMVVTLVVVLMTHVVGQSVVTSVLGDLFHSPNLHYRILGLSHLLGICSVCTGVPLALIVFSQWHRRAVTRSGWHLVIEWGRWLIVAVAVSGLLLAMTYWPDLARVLQPVAGVILPTLGGILILGWANRSPTWRIMLLLWCGTSVSAVLQTPFSAQNFMPMFACACYLAANEIVGGVRRIQDGSRETRAWIAVCLAGVAHLVIRHWWPAILVHLASL